MSSSDDPAVPGTSRAGTFTVPYTDPVNDIHAPPLDSRQGTSSTRYEQQSMTHAHGQLAHGTPAVHEDGQGVEQAIIEPRTVGQAPKETPLYREEKSAPSMLDQAQQMATQTYEKAAQISAQAMSAVGIGGGAAKKSEGTPEAQAKPEDPRVDGMQKAELEDFLRSQTMSKPESSKG